MKESSSISDADQKQMLLQAGWRPLEVQGEGGGARIYKVLSMQASERLIDALLTPQDRSVAETRAAELAVTLSDFIAGRTPLVCAAKPQRLANGALVTRSKSLRRSSTTT